MGVSSLLEAGAIANYQLDGLETELPSPRSTPRFVGSEERTLRIAIRRGPVSHEPTGDEFCEEFTRTMRLNQAPLLESWSAIRA